MDSKNSIYIIGGPRAAGKSTLLEHADTDIPILDTEDLLYNLLTEHKDLKTKDQLLEQEISEKTGKELVERIYERSTREMILDTYFYRDCYLGIPKNTIKYMKEKFEDTDFYIAHITCDIGPLMNRRKKRGLDSRFRKVFDDKKGNEYGFKVYRDILQEDPRKSMILNNHDIETSIEIIEQFLEGKEVCPPL